MPSAALYLWDLAVALAVFGFGTSALRLLRFKRAPLALSGVLGVSLFIALGGWLNLLHILRPGVFFTLVTFGVLLVLIELLHKVRSKPEALPPALPHTPLTIPAKLLYATAVAILGIMMLGGMRQTLWNGDDLQGYAALAVKAAQMRSIQPDPFCERRVQAGVGGANFLDTMMYATGNLRAMPFIDSTLGLFLYALGLWTIGRRWRTPPAGIAFALLCLPFATLVKLNLTIIYISVAAFFAILVLLSDIEPEEPFGTARIFTLGIIVGALATTKSPNIVFAVPFLIATALVCKHLQPRTKAILPISLSLLIGAAVFLPYSIANKTNAGTYLYPLFGPGIHISAYHLIPNPSQLGTWQHLLVVLAPNIVSLSLALLISWKLTQHWHLWPRATLTAFLFASLIAVPITAYGLGGEDTDRYTAPFAMPALLLLVLVVLCSPDATLNADTRFWRRIGFATLGFAAICTSLFIGPRPVNVRVLATEATNRLPPANGKDFVFTLSPEQIKTQLNYGAQIQSALPPGVVVLSLMQPAYIFNFVRDTIDIVDFPGMASPSPGLPLLQNATIQKRFLIQQGIDYIIYDRNFALPTPCRTSNWSDYLQQPRRRYPWKDLLGLAGTAHVVHTQGITHMFQNIGAGHSIRPWATVEAEVSCHEQQQIYQIVQDSPQVYNDGRVIVARIN